ncbi:UDP-glycosyltransferase UGT5-like, partial [Nymphalis io]|uniref:UDP-glycosyltransferase UGT5-like n=1 Tax=Inachis io TaxID=171585 RepID=UPI00216749DE
MILKTSILYLAYLLTVTQSAKILAVFPVPSISHQVVFRAITLELVKRGHEVTVITPNPAFQKGEAPANLTEIDIHDIAYSSWKNNLQNKYKVNENLNKFRQRTDLPSMIFLTQLQSPEVQELIANKNNKFDIILLEAAIRPAYMSEADENAMLKENFGPDVPPLSELYDNVHMLFLNIHPIWADNQPVPPGVVYMGGIHQLPVKELPKDLKTYLDSSERGVIYVSFGTNVLSGMMPEEKVKVIANVLSKLPYNVLWKWDKDELPVKSKNIRSSKWFPQSDLLRHPKIKLFVTQAGLQSTDEAITAGVPLVAIPMLGDQWYNADKYVKHGIGMNLEIGTLTEDKLKNAIETVISDKSYRENIIKLREFMRDQPETPLQRSIWWIEYMIRHGGAKQLRPPTANISLAQYFEMELVFIVLSVVFIALILSLVVIVFIIRFLLNLLRGKKKIKISLITSFEPKMILKTSILYLAYLLTVTQSAKILAVFPVPSISHQVVFRAITLELVKRGHEVTVITPNPAFQKGEAPANLTEIDIHDIAYSTWKSNLQNKYKVNENISKFRQRTDMPAIIFLTHLKSPEVQELIANKNNKFDIILLEAAIRPAIVYSHIFKAPIILVSSLVAMFNNHAVMGSATHPILYPTMMQFKLYNLTFWEKLNNLYIHYSLEYKIYMSEADENAMLKENFGPDVPPLSELYDNVHMLFLNIHPIWADNQPVPPGVVYMGGIHQLPEKELPEDLKTYLDSSERGVIYVSFGTNVLSGMMPEEKVKVIANVLSKLPYNVLWKWDKDELPVKSKNIRSSKWFPQSDLLRHPKIKLFVTQAGLQSTDEAITAGVPLVAIPMLGDQWYNADKYVKHGIGMNLEIGTLTEDKLKNAIETVINDKSYRQNIIKLRELMRDQPETPLQRSIWWIEYMIRHGGAKQLRPPTANISLAQYFEMELVFIVLSVVFIALILSLVVIVFIIRFFLNLLRGKKKI